MKIRLLAGTLLVMSAAPCFAQAGASVPVQTVVTVEARKGDHVPALNPQDFLVYQGKDRLPVSGAVPLTGNNADLELWLLLDDGSDWTLGTELNELRAFVNGLPATTFVAVGYMRNGMVDTVAKMTKDHAGAARAIRLPLSAGSSPWLSLSELVKHWPASAARHEVVMLTSGVDPLGGTGIINPYLDAAIADTQRAGVIVYPIYTPGAGHSGHSYWRMNWGQNHMAQLAEETGGEAYMLGFGTPVSIAPYLKDITRSLEHQYRVSFPAKPESKAELRPIRFTTEVPNAEIVATSKVFVPAGFAGR